MHDNNNKTTILLLATNSQKQILSISLEFSKRMLNINNIDGTFTTLFSRP